MQLTVEQLAITSGDGFAQRLATGNFGVVGITFAQRLDGGVSDEIRGGEIRVADTEDDHILAATPCFKRRIVNIPGCNTLT